MATARLLPSTESGAAAQVRVGRSVAPAHSAGDQFEVGVAEGVAVGGRVRVAVAVGRGVLVDVAVGSGVLVAVAVGRAVGVGVIMSVLCARMLTSAALKGRV